MIRHLGGKFVQEVNAVSLSVEKLYPEVQSVVELGGQDAKIIIFKEDKKTGKKKKIPSMNDKCAGGTGAVIDKINAKLQIPSEEANELAPFHLQEFGNIVGQNDHLLLALTEEASLHELPHGQHLVG